MRHGTQIDVPAFLAGGRIQLVQPALRPSNGPQRATADNGRAVAVGRPAPDDPQTRRAGPYRGDSAVHTRQIDDVAAHRRAAETVTHRDARQLTADAAGPVGP